MLRGAARIRGRIAALKTDSHCDGATTYGERTSNMAEREMATQAVAESGLRTMHPLEFVATATVTMFSKLAKEVALHEQCDNAGEELVPHAIALLNKHSELANRIEAEICCPDLLP